LKKNPAEEDEDVERRVQIRLGISVPCQPSGNTISVIPNDGLL
jgi:hypothetical protein